MVLYDFIPFLSSLNLIGCRCDIRVNFPKRIFKNHLPRRLGDGAELRIHAYDISFYILYVCDFSFKEKSHFIFLAQLCA